MILNCTHIIHNPCQITTSSAPQPPPNNAVTPQAAPPRPSGTTYVPGLSMKSARVTCPYCREQAVTNTKSQIDCCTIIGVIVMILVFWPLFWIPFICPCCKTTEHYCSRCHRKVRHHLLLLGSFVLSTFSCFSLTLHYFLICFDP